MKVALNINSSGVSLQLFDALYSYRQSLSSSYKSDLDIVLGPDPTADLNVLYAYMPDDTLDINGYDIVFFDNGAEPLSVSSIGMHKHYQKDNVYIIANSYLPKTHTLHGTVLWNPHQIMQCLQLWTSRFYPHYYENQKNLIECKQKPTLAAINGANRTVRHHFFKKLIERIPTLAIKTDINKGILNTNHSFWESVDDQTFRNELENDYSDIISVWNEEDIDYQYYDKSISVGIDGKFGSYVPGYHILPIYYENACVIFPESSWQNDELSVTEKSLKCFYARSLPFPVGGANINNYYNEIGLTTAWNLLPTDLKKFDQILDHKKRHELAVLAVQWLMDNNTIFLSKEFLDLTNENNRVLLTANLDILPVKQINKVFETYERRH